MKTRFVDKLIGMASSVDGRYRLAAMVYDDKHNPISFGTNSYVKTHPVQAALTGAQKIFIHAEIQALLRASGRQSRGILVVRVNKHGLAMARPCRACYWAIIVSGLSEIMYSDETGSIMKEYVDRPDEIQGRIRMFNGRPLGSHVRPHEEFV
jgi:tRNA(Arg) A34 adenosine deaminase TadA